LEENIENFQKVGFDLEILGSNTVMINGIPDFTKEKDAI
jgi:DNA mismatch repair ATPase MutL